MKNEYKWKKSKGGWLFGVCQGLGKSLNQDPNLLRVIWLISTISFGLGLPLYIVFALVLPNEDEMVEYQNKKFLGVCVRLAKKMNIELAAARLGMVILTISSVGAVLAVYFILHFILPTEKTENQIEY